jgi:predicted nucleic acid-binding protein
VLFASNYVAEEAKRNLSGSEQLTNLEAFLSMVQLVPDVDPNIPCPIELPEKDRPVLLAAISIKANYLLTGDMIHFGKYFGQTVRGIKICLPRGYIIIAEQRKTKK